MTSKGRKAKVLTRPKEFRNCICKRHYHVRLLGKEYTYHTDGTATTEVALRPGKGGKR